MKRAIIISLLAALVVACSVSMKKNVTPKPFDIPAGTYEDTLRFLYSLPRTQWPAPTIDRDVKWEELNVIPDSPLKPHLDSLKHLVALGKTLFFDARLSGGNKISCANCHIPDLSWSDGRQRSIGHDMQVNKRNSSTILNTWFYKELFWDGRSRSLEDQAFSPINSETEMHSEMSEMIPKLRRVEGYKVMFKAAYGTIDISPETVTHAIAMFERTLTSRNADFDDFLLGNRTAMKDAALRGLHLFRTKARCMNCHNGALLSDNQYHNTGLANYKQANEDLGRYNFTKKAGDAGRFRTPSLRDVMRTNPWMHNGLFDNMEKIVERYDSGITQSALTTAQQQDSLFPRTDPLIKKLHLTTKEKLDLIAFLHSITAALEVVTVPEMPR